MNRTNPFAIWKRRHDLDHVQGVQLEGDPFVPPTPSNPFMLFWYIHFVWRTVVVFQYDKSPNQGFRIGFRNSRGETYVRGGGILYERRFAVRIGCEPCTFFALDALGSEIPLRKIAATLIGDTDYSDVPLY